MAIIHTNLDVGEIRQNNPVHDAPHMSDWIFVSNSDAQLFSDKGPSALAAKQVL